MIATTYPAENPKGACYQWQVFEAIWRLYEAGECGPMDGGVLTRRLAEEIGGIDVSSMRARCRALEEEGAVARLDSVNPDTWGPTSSWAPTALLEQETGEANFGASETRTGGHA